MLLDFLSQRFRVSPVREILLYCLPLGILNPTNPTPTFARDVPVGHTVNSRYKYIRFQSLAATTMQTAGNCAGFKERKPHISGGNFIQLRLGTGSGKFDLRRLPGLHERENPLREERSCGKPVNAPAWRRKRCFPARNLALSIWSRTSCAIGTPVSRDVSRSQPSSSSVRRAVIW
jgi:hypothetical protein